MDSLSQIVLGAATAELVAGKKLGNKAMLWGAIAGTIPDLDVFVTFTDPIKTLAFHRGFSHSLAFAFIVAPILGYILHKLYKKSDATWRDWTLLFLISIGTHPLLDCFTTWGTSLLLPFSDTRIAWNTIFVVDPLWTLPFLALVVAAMFYAKESSKRRWLNGAGLIFACCYLAFTVGNKMRVDNIVETSLNKQGITYNRYMTNPTPLNNVLWYTMVETDDNYYLGYTSMFDRDNHVQFYALPRKQTLPANLQNDERINTILFVSNGFYTVTGNTDTLYIHDLRFGLMNGLNPVEEPSYVFTYLIDNSNPAEPVFEVLDPNRAEPGKVLGLIWKRLKGN